ncbi:MAG TPA: MlaD family protein [Spirochaetia bacterium]|nr:MlaD family protein [Spirochaetia bacterium]
MKFKIRFADQIVGIFVLAALAAVVVVLVLIGVNQRWFARNYAFTSRFSSASGLFVGMPISLKGFEIGKISAISLSPQNEVDVKFTIEDTYYNRVKPDSVLELTSSPIGLGVTLKFHSGKNALSPVPEGSYVPSLDTEEGQALVAEGRVDIPKDADVIGSVIAKLNPVLDETRLTIAEIRRVASTVDLALNGGGGPMGTMVNGLAQTPGKVNTAVDDINTKVATVLDKVSVIADNVNDISVQTRGVIGDLSTNLDVISQNLKEMTASLKNTQGLAKRLLDPSGSMDTFLNDSNELYNQVDSALKNVNEITAQLKSFAEFVNGTRPQVTSLLEKGSSTLSTANDVLEAAKNNPLLKGGVPSRTAPGAPMSSYRDENF